MLKYFNWRVSLVLAILFFTSTDLIRSQDKTVTYYQDAAANPADLSITLRHLTADINFKPEENLVRAKTWFIFYPNRYQTD